MDETICPAERSIVESAPTRAHSPLIFPTTFKFQSSHFLKFIAPAACVFDVSVREVHLESSEEGALGELVWVEAEKSVVVAEEEVWTTACILQGSGPQY